MSSCMPKHLQWLEDTGRRLSTSDGITVEVWQLSPDFSDREVLSAWARHFRNHYCPDTLIDVLRAGTGLSRRDYLLQLKFPDSRCRPGPSIRAGDFAEILVADYLEFVLAYSVPRVGYADKAVRNQSRQGCDVIGYRIYDESKLSPNDILAIYEAKAQLTRSGARCRLQEAVQDSNKDQIRKAETLNAVKQKLILSSNSSQATHIERFQNPADRPFTEVSGAVAVLSTVCFDPTTISNLDTSTHYNRPNLRLLIISGNDLMNLANQLYTRSADEA